MRADVVVIGSGLGGLVCARLLAEQGCRVLVLEQATQPGGCTLAYRRRGVELDTGLHYIGGLGDGESLHGIFRQLGLLDLPWQRMDDCFEHIRHEGHDYYFSQGFDNFATTLAKDFPEDAEGLRTIASLLRQTASASAHDEQFQQQIETSAWDFLCQTIHNPLLREILCVPISLKGEMRKESLPLFTWLHVNSGCIESAWRLKSSGNQIVNVLIDAIQQRGGEVKTQQKVVELVQEEGRITRAVCADGNVYEADLFISDAHPAQTMQMVSGKAGIFGRRVSRLENTEGSFTVSLVLKSGVLPYFNYNQYLMRGEQRMLISARTPEDNSHYATVLDLLQPMSIHAFPRDEHYEESKQAHAEEAILWAEEAIPGLSGMVEHRYVSTPHTYKRYTLTPDGSSFGLRKDWRNPLTTFLSPRTPYANLFLTGQSLMVHGMQGVTMAAADTVSTINALLQS